MDYIGKTKFSKTVSVILSLTVTIWLSGVALLVPFAAFSAVTIVDGDTIRNPNAEGVAQFDIYIVKLVGGKKFKRLVLNPQVFESYGHLRWEDVKDVDQSTIDAYTTSELVRTDGDEKVYKLVPDGDTGTKEWLNMTAEEFGAMYDWDSIYTVNSTDIGNYNAGDDVVVNPGTAGIMLSSDTPATGYVAQSTYNNEITKIDFSAGSTGYIIDSIKITRSGLSADADLLDVRLFDGGTQFGSTQSLNSTTHKATFNNLNWTIPANGTKTLTIKGSIAANPTSTVGDVIKLGIASTDDITLSSGTLPTAAYPIYGNGKTIAGVSVGRMEVMASTAVAARNLVSGTTDQLVGGFNFESITEAFSVNKIVITEAGSAVAADLTNIKILVDGEQVGSTVASLGSDEKATFTGAPLFDVASGTNKDVFIYADIVDGITSERTVQWQIFETDDVEAIGGNSGGITLIKGDSNVTFATVSSPSTANTIYQGQATVTFDIATTPADQTNTVVGATDVLVNAFKFSATTREGLNVTYLKLDLDTTGTEVTATDISNARLYIDDSTTPISTVGTIGSSSISFGTTGSSTTLFNVPKGKNVVAKLKLDISTTASDSDQVGYYISSTANLTIRGEGSGDKIPTGNMTITGVDAVSDSGAGQLNIQGNGTLTVASAPDTPAATTYTDGVSGLSVFKFRLTSEYEDMNVTTIKIRLWDASGNSDETAVDDTDFENIKLYDGATLLDTVSLASGIATFNLNGFSVPKDTTKTLSVVLDVPQGSTLTNSLYLTVGLVTGWTGGATITDAGELTTTGADSLQAIDETGDAISSAMTEGSPSLTVAASASPAAKSVVTGATEVWMGRILMTANNEDIKVTSFRTAISNSSTLASLTTTVASANWSNMKIKAVQGSNVLYESGGKAITNAGNNLIDFVLFSDVDFTVQKDQTVAVDIYADAVGTATAWYVGITDSTSQIQGSGLSSGTAVAVSPSAAYASAGVTITSNGSMTISVDADTPAASNIAVGTGGVTGVSFSKIKFEAGTPEDVKVKKIRISRSGGQALDLAAIKLYDGATQIGVTGYMSGSTVTFTDDTNGLFTLAAGTSKVITVKADLNGTVAGGNSVSADAPILYIADVTSTDNYDSVGVSSKQDIAGTAGTPAPQTAGNYGAQTIYKSVPTFSLNASSPAGTQSPGTGKEVLRFDVAANSLGDVVFNEVAFTVAGNINARTTDPKATLTGSGNAEIYKSTDLTTPLAYAPYVAGTVSDADSTTVATADSSSANPWAGIPVGAHVKVYDLGTTEYLADTYKVTASTDVSNVATITVTPALSAAFATGDIIYYRPMEPGSGTGAGKLFFGGQTTLGADLASGDTSMTVASTDGFAPGDVVTVSGYDSSGNAISDATVTVSGVTNATTLAITGFLASATIDYDYNYSAGDTDDLAVVFVTTRKNDSGTSVDALVGETIAAGTTKTFVVKGDTTGADSSTGTETISLNFNAISDVNWDDTIRFGVTALTGGLPLLGGTLSY